MNYTTQNKLLTTARSLIGTSYSTLDCSHFVQKVYASAGMTYPYMNSAAFVGKNNKSFTLIGTNVSISLLEPGDIIVFGGHMGIWDPNGCDALGANQQCQKLKNNAPFLSSRTTDNRGPDFGVLKWWPGDYKVYRWPK